MNFSNTNNSASNNSNSSNSANNAVTSGKTAPTTNTIYASITKKKISPLTDFDYPSEEQGLTFPYLVDTKIIDYLQALKIPVGGAKNIIAAFRVSNNRVVVFLCNTQMVEKFLLKIYYQNFYLK